MYGNSAEGYYEEISRNITLRNINSISINERVYRELEKRGLLLEREATNGVLSCFFENNFENVLGETVIDFFPGNRDEILFSSNRRFLSKKIEIRSEALKDPLFAADYLVWLSERDYAVNSNCSG